ncbi:MAG: MAPEG family protein [Parvularcula sp.]
MTTILLPMFVMMGLTFVVLLFIPMIRVPAVAANKSLAHRAALDASAFGEKSQKVANNFANLTQLPMLFYVGCVFAYFTGASSPLVLGSAWAFVGARIIHTMIHTTTNNMRQRFLVFVFATITLVVFLVAVFAHVIAHPLVLGN